MIFQDAFKLLCCSIDDSIHAIVFGIILAIGTTILYESQDDFWFCLIKVQSIVGTFNDLTWLDLLIKLINPGKFNNWKAVKLTTTLLSLRTDIKGEILKRLKFLDLEGQFQSDESDMVYKFHIRELLEALGDYEKVNTLLKSSNVYNGRLKIPTKEARDQLWKTEITSSISSKTTYDIREFIIEKSIKYSENSSKFAHISRTYVTVICQLPDSSSITIQFDISSVRNLKQDNSSLRFHLIQPPKSTNTDLIKFPALSMITLRFVDSILCTRFKQFLGKSSHLITVSSPRKISEPIDIIELDEIEDFEEDALQSTNQVSLFTTNPNETDSTAITTSKSAVSQLSIQNSRDISGENEDECVKTNNYKSPDFVPIGDTQDVSQREIAANIQGFRDRKKSGVISEVITSSFPVVDDDLIKLHSNPLKLAIMQNLKTARNGSDQEEVEEIWDFISGDILDERNFRNSIINPKEINDSLPHNSTPKVCLDRSKIQLTNTIKKLNIETSSGNLYDQIYEEEGQTSPVSKAQSRATTRANRKSICGSSFVDRDVGIDNDDDSIHSDVSYKPSLDPKELKPRARPKRLLNSVVTEINVNEIEKLETRPSKKVKISSIKYKERLERKLEKNKVHDFDGLEISNSISLQRSNLLFNDLVSKSRTISDSTSISEENHKSDNMKPNQIINESNIVSMKTYDSKSDKLIDNNVNAKIEKVPKLGAIANQTIAQPSILSEAYTNHLQNQIFESITNFSNGLISKIKVINQEVNKKIVNDLTNKYEHLFRELNINFNNDVKEMVELIDDIKDLLHLDEKEIIGYIKDKKFMSQTQGN